MEIIETGEVQAEMSHGAQAAGPPHEYWRVDNRRFSLRDCWGLSNRAITTFVVLFLAKLLRIRINLPSLGLRSRTWRDLEVTREDLSAAVERTLLPRVQEALALGFHLVGWQSVQEEFAENDGGSAILAHED